MTERDRGGFARRCFKFFLADCFSQRPRWNRDFFIYCLRCFFSLRFFSFSVVSSCFAWHGVVSHGVVSHGVVSRRDRRGTEIFLFIVSVVIVLGNKFWVKIFVVAP